MKHLIHWFIVITSVIIIAVLIVKFDNTPTTNEIMFTVSLSILSSMAGAWASYKIYRVNTYNKIISCAKDFFNKYLNLNDINEKCPILDPPCIATPDQLSEIKLRSHKLIQYLVLFYIDMYKLNGQENPVITHMINHVNKILWEISEIERIIEYHISDKEHSIPLNMIRDQYRRAFRFTELVNDIKIIVIDDEDLESHYHLIHGVKIKFLKN